MVWLIVGDGIKCGLRGGGGIRHEILAVKSPNPERSSEEVRFDILRLRIGGLF